MESCQCKEKNANAFNADKFKEFFEEEKYDKINDNSIDLNGTEISTNIYVYLDRYIDLNFLNIKEIKKELR